MRKVVAAINMTLDGFCDHTAVDPDEEIHQHYADLLRMGEVILYGRITYQLMEYWKPIAVEPTGEKAMDDFAVVMDRIPKIVFSHTLQDLDWDSATWAGKTPEAVVQELKQQPGGDILVGSRSIMMHLLNLGLIDELQLCIHPVIAAGGLPLFEQVQNRITLKLLHTKTFASGALICYYAPHRNDNGAQPDGL